jgi:glycosyltransferase involved in cell wall biosynthesis
MAADPAPLERRRTLHAPLMHREGPISTQRVREACVQSRSYRVLMVAPTSFFADYGCHVRILEEARALQDLGQRVTIVTYQNGNPVAGLDIRRTLPIPGRRNYEVGSSRHKIAFDALLGLKTVELLARKPFDVIHAHLHEGALIGILLGKLWRKPVVFDLQGSMTEEMIDHHFLRRDSPTYRLLRWLEWQIDHKAPAILTSSGHARRLLLDQFNCHPERVRALPDCVNTEVFRPAGAYDAQALAALRAQLGIPADRKLIVYLGLLAEYQGTGLLLQAMRQLVEEGAAVHLLLMGFPAVETYRQRAEQLGISTHVTFTGRVPYQQAPIYLALGDVATAPKLSLTEGSGKILNYMAVGLPVVAFDTPVAREYLGPDGLFATRGDVDSLAYYLRSCLFPPSDSPDAYVRMGQCLRQRAIQQFSWEAAGHTIIETYEELLGDTSSRVVPSPNWAATRQ